MPAAPTAGPMNGLIVSMKLLLPLAPVLALDDSPVAFREFCNCAAAAGLAVFSALKLESAVASKPCGVPAPAVATSGANVAPIAPAPPPVAGPPAAPTGARVGSGVVVTAAPPGAILEVASETPLAPAPAPPKPKRLPSTL